MKKSRKELKRSLKLVPNSVTLNDLERENFPYFTECGCFHHELIEIITL